MSTFNGDDTPETLIYYAAQDARDRYTLSAAQLVAAMVKVAAHFAEDVNATD